MEFSTFKRSIILSFCAHAAGIILITWGVVFFRPAQFGNGQGAVVSVWLTDGGGNGAAKGKASIGRKNKEMPKNNLVSIQEKQLEPDKSAATEESGSGAKEGLGVGEGPGSKGGWGQGVIDPRLVEIVKKINRAKYYPNAAKRDKIEGSPRLTFTISENGSIKNSSISRSCGEKILDDAAIETLNRAAPLPPYPEAVTVTIKYSMK